MKGPPRAARIIKKEFPNHLLFDAHVHACRDTEVPEREQGYLLNKLLSKRGLDGAITLIHDNCDNPYSLIKGVMTPFTNLVPGVEHNTQFNQHYRVHVIEIRFSKKELIEVFAHPFKKKGIIHNNYSIINCLNHKKYNRVGIIFAREWLSNNDELLNPCWPKKSELEALIESGTGFIVGSDSHPPHHKLGACGSIMPPEYNEFNSETLKESLEKPINCFFTNRGIIYYTNNGRIIQV